MLSGGEALEAYAVRSASSVLKALARRMPSLAHRREDGQVVDVALEEVAVGDTLVVFPHEICPVDGTVIEGHGVLAWAVSGKSLRFLAVLVVATPCPLLIAIPVAIIGAIPGSGRGPPRASEVREPPGQGLRGTVAGRAIQVASRKQVVAQRPQLEEALPPLEGGMECVVVIDGRYAATLRFRDEPRAEGESFVHHLRPKHSFERVMIVSGDRESEVRYLAERVGISEVHAGQTPEQKVEIVRRETRQANTVFLGDGINDAPALTAATVGIAFGQNSDITAEAAGAVIMDTSLGRVDEFLHISRRLRSVALQSAVGGMALSLIGMVLAAAGYLPPVAGAILQEVIDVHP
jgi:cation transport ATPase